MRVIKFEAYDQEERRMIPFEELIARNEVHDFLDEFINPFTEMAGRWKSPRMYRQYTGLKDSKGTEIYEGDLVSYQKRNLSQAFGVGGGQEYLSFISEVKYRDQGFNVPQGFVINLKVIGNKFDDPDLWEENK